MQVDDDGVPFDRVARWKYAHQPCVGSVSEETQIFFTKMVRITCNPSFVLLIILILRFMSNNIFYRTL